MEYLHLDNHYVGNNVPTLQKKKDSDFESE